MKKINFKNYECSEVSEVRPVYVQKTKPKVKLTSPDDTYKYFMNVWNTDTLDYLEESYVLFLNRNNKILCWLKLSSGGVSGTVIDPKIVFAMALQVGASGVILAHNHPSGNLNASQSDVAITRKLVQGGALLEISVLDHLIVTADSYLSLKNEGTIL